MHVIVGIIVLARDEDGLAVNAVELEIGVVEGIEVSPRLELLEGEGALYADLRGRGWRGGGEVVETHLNVKHGGVVHWRGTSEAACL